MRSSAITSLILAANLLISYGVAEARDGTRPNTCTRTPVEEDATRQSTAAAAALERGNALARLGKTAEAISEYGRSEGLARQSRDLTTALFASANAARTAIPSESPASVRERLEAIEQRASNTLRKTSESDSPGDRSLARSRARLLIHLAQSWAQLAQKAPRASSIDTSDHKTDRLRAVNLLDAAAKAAESSRQTRLASFAYGYRAEIYFDAGRLKEARTLARRALIQADRADAPDSLFRWHALLARVHLQSGNPGSALRAYRSSIAGLERVSLTRQPGLDQDMDSLTTQREALYLEFVHFLLEQARDKPKGAERQDLLAEARDSLESFKTQELREYFEDACLAAQRQVTPDDVPGTVVLYPVVLRDRVALILSANQELSLYDVALGRDALDDAVQQFRRGLPNRMTRGYLREAATLYDALIRPIESSFDSAETLVVVPGGSLRSIPFAALYDLKQEQFLIEKIAIASAPGLTLTDPQPLSVESTRALVAGLSESVQGYAALESVPAEIAGVGATFRSDILLNEAFKASTFEKVVEKKLVGVVHIASHGEFLADFSKSFILTHDGRLTMERLAKTIGRTRFRTDEPLELLVLSACETAAGDPRAALGLAGVALQAGARSAVATLWSVNDVAAGRIVQRFYAALARGASRAEALRIAQREMIADPDFRHAANWAPFLLISSWL